MLHFHLNSISNIGEISLNPKPIAINNCWALRLQASAGQTPFGWLSNADPFFSGKYNGPYCNVGENGDPNIDKLLFVSDLGSWFCSQLAGVFMFLHGRQGLRLVTRRV